MAHEKTLYRYRGDGTYRIPGVPTRDLTEGDVEALSPEQRREVAAAAPHGEPLYAPTKNAPDAPPIPTTPEPTTTTTTTPAPVAPGREGE